MRGSIDMERCETCAKAGGPAQALYAERIAQAEEWTQRNVGFALVAAPGG